MAQYDEDFAPRADAANVIKYKQWSVGDKVQGRIVAIPKKLPDTDYATKQQKVSKAGNLKWKYAITLEIDGESWRIFPDGKLYFDVLNAFREGGVSRYEDTLDGAFAMKRVNDTPPETPGFQPAKNYIVKFVKGENL